MDELKVFELLISLVGGGIIYFIKRMDSKLDRCATKEDVKDVHRRCDEQDAQILTVSNSVSRLEGVHEACPKSPCRK